MEEVQDKIKQIQEAKKAYLKLIKTEGKGLIQQLIDNLFAEVPTLEEVRWAQYTPFFNDGDTCEFSVRDPEFKFAKIVAGPGEEDEDRDSEEDEDDDDNEDFIDSYSLSDALKKVENRVAINQACKRFDKTLHELEEVLEITFGDHVEVHATRKRVYTEEYEHE